MECKEVYVSVDIEKEGIAGAWILRVEGVVCGRWKWAGRRRRLDDWEE